MKRQYQVTLNSMREIGELEPAQFDLELGMHTSCPMRFHSSLGTSSKGCEQDFLSRINICILFAY